MTNQEKIKYLKQYKYLDDHINQLLEEKEQWRNRAEKMTPTWSDMPKGGTDDENLREMAICKMMDCERLATRMIDEYVDLGKEIKAVIDTVDDIGSRLLLNYRYIEGLTFEEIAYKMSYSWRQVHRIHSEALNKINMS